tara:strand:- start:238 stop:387 length:150 start_codon:yes stop_codon:yes gene_type:complete
MLSLIQSLVSGGAIILGKLIDGDWIKMTDVNWADVNETNWSAWDETADT